MKRLIKIFSLLVCLVISSEVDLKTSIKKDFLTNVFKQMINEREIIKDYSYSDVEIVRIKKNKDYIFETFLIPKEKTEKKNFETKKEKKILSNFVQDSSNHHMIHLRVTNFSLDVHLKPLRTVFLSNAILEIKFGFVYDNNNVTMKPLASNLVTDVSGVNIKPEDHQKHCDLILQKISKGIWEETTALFNEYIQPKPIDLTIKSDSSPVELSEFITNFQFGEEVISIGYKCEIKGLDQFHFEETTWKSPTFNLIDEEFEVSRQKLMNKESNLAEMEIGENIFHQVLLVIANCVSNPSTFKERLKKLLEQSTDNNLKAEVEGLDVMLNSGTFSIFKIKFMKISERYISFKEDRISVKIPLLMNLYGLTSQLFIEIEVKIKKEGDEIITSVTKFGFEETGDEKLNLIEEDELQKDDIKDVFQEMIGEFKNEGVQIPQVIQSFLIIFHEFKFEEQMNREKDLYHFLNPIVE